MLTRTEAWGFAIARALSRSCTTRRSASGGYRRPAGGNLLMRDWVRAMQESEIKHMQDTYGPDAEIPKAQTPYGQLTNTIPVTKTAPARIAELAQELTGAAH